MIDAYTEMMMQNQKWRCGKGQQWGANVKQARKSKWGCRSLWDPAEAKKINSQPIKVIKKVKFMAVDRVNKMKKIEKICKNCIKFDVPSWCKSTKDRGFCNHRSYSNGRPIVKGDSSCEYFSAS